jgi:hypothetical protein
VALRPAFDPPPGLRLAAHVAPSPLTSSIPLKTAGLFL